MGERAPREPDIHETLDNLFPGVPSGKPRGGEIPVETPVVLDIQPKVIKTTEFDFIGPLARIEAAVTKQCGLNGLHIPDLPMAQKPMLSQIAEAVIRTHASDLINNIHNENPDEKLFLVPGSASPGLQTYYDRTRANRNNPDKSQHRAALAYQFPLVEEALAHSYLFPEVHLAEGLEEKWQDEGYKNAADAASAVIATYGLRIGATQRAAAQRALGTDSSYARPMKKQIDGKSLTYDL